MKPPHLIGSDAAARRVGVDPTQFSKWARRRGLKPQRYVTVGRLRYAIWDLDEVLDALATGPVARKEVEGNGN